MGFKTYKALIRAISLQASLNWPFWCVPERLVFLVPKIPKCGAVALAAVSSPLLNLVH